MRNFVPRADNDNTTIGTAEKRWTKVYCMDIDVANGISLGDVTAGSEAVPTYIKNGTNIPCNMLTSGSKEWPGLPQVSGTGIMEIGKNLDFHLAPSASAKDYTVRLYVKNAAAEKYATTNDTMYCTGNFECVDLTANTVKANSITGLTTLDADSITVKGNITTTEGNLVATTGKVTAKGLAITGDASVTGSLTVANSAFSGNNIYLRNPNIQFDANPTAARINSIYFRDANNNNYATLIAQKATTGIDSMYLRTYQTGSTTKYFELRLSCLTDGTGYASLTSSPAEGDNSTKIATTAFVKTAVDTAKTALATSIQGSVPKNVGTATKPVYSNANGVITACTYELKKTVPADAVFTDTVTTVATTGAGNAITDITASNGKLTVTKGTTFLKSGDSVVKKAGSATQPVYFSADNVATPCNLANQTDAAGFAQIIANSTNTNFDSTGSYVQINGLLIQWGIKSYASNAATVTFTRPFTSKPSVVTSVNNHGDGNHGVPVDTTTTTGFKVTVDHDLNSSGYIHWVAIGYHS